MRSLVLHPCIFQLAFLHAHAHSALSGSSGIDFPNWNTAFQPLLHAQPAVPHQVTVPLATQGLAHTTHQLFFLTHRPGWSGLKISPTSPRGQQHPSERGVGAHKHHLLPTWGQCWCPDVHSACFISMLEPKLTQPRQSGRSACEPASVANCLVVTCCVLILWIIIIIF